MAQSMIPGTNQGARPDVICVGVNPAFDITIKLTSLVSGEVSRAYQDNSAPAGKALNVCRSLIRSGHNAEYICLLGESNESAYTAELRRLGIKYRAVMCGGATRENLTLLVDGTEKEYKINRQGFSVTGDDYTRLERVLDSGAIPDGGKKKIAVFSGSMPPGMDPGQYCSLMLKAGNAGSLVAVDTEALTEEQLTGLSPWLYKPNDRELIRLLGLDNITGLCGSQEYRAQLTDAASELSRRGVQNILLTFGQYGLALIREGKVEADIRGSGTVLRNSTGAGDRALAGFISAYLEGGTPSECAGSAVLEAETAAV